MKYLIVNADDFGASGGINRGIVEAQRYGILTAASLLVDAPWSEEAAVLGRAIPAMSVGLHVRLAAGAAVDPDRCRAELLRQFRRFEELTGEAPSHLDSHHNVHAHPRLASLFRDFAAEHNLPLRGHSPIRCLTKFYGRWGGESHPEQISAANLARLLKTELQEGVTEFVCHPGYEDPGFSTSYAAERRIELRTLCDPMVRQVLAGAAIRLIDHREAASLLTAGAM